MLKTNKARLQILLLISLSSYICTVNALDTVSSYEKSQAQNAGAAPESNADNPEQTNYNLDQLANELKNRGWNINKEEDGTLVLTPKVPSKKAINKENGEIDQWQQIQQKFIKAGWEVERDADGSIRLYPQQKQPATSDVKKLSKENNTIINIENSSFISADMQKQLREKGWGVTNNSDGSILLYPPEQAPSAIPKPCYGSATTVNIDLPVNTWQEAHDIAQGWLLDNSIGNAAVGKIRKIINVYIISIVANKSPYTLMHQVAIRSNDGAVILLN